MTNKTKRQYRIRNWQEYNKALVSRGSLIVWIDSRSIDKWLNQDSAARRGRRRTYTDLAIERCLLFREVYHLPLRATQGLVRSVIGLISLRLPFPDYSTLSRRARLLHLSLSPHPAKTISHLVIDSTGLKVYGEGEWKVRIHGADKRRTWRQLHLSMDASTHHVTAALLTDKDALDRNSLPTLLRQTEAEVERVCGDGAYDFEQCYRAIKERKAGALIPPRSDAVVRGKSPFEARDENLREIKRRGRKGWKNRSGYHQRSRGF